ncbi:MAG: hypothetical protein CMH56_08775 [Myxococcales bacterium]|nr:hypothetical protein [Myxococcales bacterium]|tara:strand:+ start:501 stop:1001 length:501 start_codon:yes stop_codon:yes gene_type:complete
MNQLENNKPKTLRVVAALIRDEGKVLLTQRWPGGHLGLTWEFPGGKVEMGETDEQALRRELEEELGVVAEIGTMCFETKHGYPGREIHLRVYRAKLISGEPKAIDVNDMQWAEVTGLLDRRFPPADMPLVRGLVEGLVPEFEESEEDEGDSFVPAKVVGFVPQTSS